MIVIANVKGWRKRFDVPYESILRGIIKVRIDNPINMTISDSNSPVDQLTYSEYVLYRSGTNNAGIPIFLLKE